MIVILIHGFNVWDGGRATVGRLAPFFNALGVPHFAVNYGHFGLLETRFKNIKVAERVAAACKAAVGQKVIVIGHSNGCAIAHLAARAFGAKIDKMVYINPALKKDMPLPASVGALDVWHSPSDKPVRVSKWLLPSRMRPWGEMGATGYQGGEDTRITNFNKEVNYPVHSSEHSDVFTLSKLPYFGPLITKTAIGDNL
ncbi:alpha/beta hydrolase [Porticoccaceae bacterium]|nr:alpha/beta hydrolase [Porticoccaceae bacterium]